MANKPIVLIILDGWGYREETDFNPTRTVATPTFDFLWKNYPRMLLKASGEDVGLPAGQIGNSEVGHLHIGSGRKVPQDLTRIDHAIESGDFFKNPTLLDALKQAKTNNSAVHVLGLLSPGGVHSHERQIMALFDFIHQQQIKNHYLHAFLDGRDVPPRSALASLKKFDDYFSQKQTGKIASIIGRYYAMDRDKRWDRTEKAYDLLTLGTAEFTATSAEAALLAAYERGENDEFVKATNIQQPNEKPITINDNDIVIFMNYRPDRARQLTRAFTENNFDGFFRQKQPKLASFVSLTQYAKDLHTQIAFPPLQMSNTLGEFLATHGFKQLRIAETEKYAHITYFLNGGIEKPFTAEDRILIPSPKVATYDLQPEMSAYELTDKLVEAINSKNYDVIMCNYANPDMIGHTGLLPAAEKAVSVMDVCMKRVIDALQSVNGEALITSDHGNIEQMYDPKHRQPHTAHTNNLVPLIYFGKQAKFIAAEGCLDDIAPTLLYLLNLKQPGEMTGKILLDLL